jgi:hypothetical protein
MIMKLQTTLALTALLVMFSCNQNQQQNPTSFLPKVTEAIRYAVPKDSVAEPKVMPAAKPWKIVPAGKPKVVPVGTNVRLAGKPTIFLADLPTVRTPGQGSFSLPKTFPARGKTILAGSPRVVAAKDAMAKDQNSYNFSSFGKLQGLINETIHSLLRDTNGNLWIGTYGGGVSKYDGVSFTHFTEKEGLGNNVVVTILEDKNKNLWFGTLGGGVCKYDGKTFTHFTEKEGLGSNFVNSIIEDKGGNVWIGTSDAGVTKYDPDDRRQNVSESQTEDHQSSQPTFTRFTENEGLSNNGVWNITEDKQGNLWFATGGGGMCKYDGKSFTHFTGKENISAQDIGDYVVKKSF